MSSSLARLKLLLRLVPRLLILPGLKPELLVLLLSLLISSEYLGGGSERFETGARLTSILLSRVGVGEGVISVLGDISTSSASRYHFLLLVYLPHPS